MKKIFVTRPYLPPIDRYKSYIDQIWDANHLTNHGPQLQSLEQKLKSYLGVDYFHFLTNGTLALQIALRAFDITDGDVITTPFSYVATTSSIMWERCNPIFVDIDPHTYCIDAQKIEAAITAQTKAIMAVHVFGYPCNVEAIEAIARKHNLKVIYDAAHAFGSKYKHKSLLDYGDIATCSFHATKLFHTIEGGAIISHSAETHHRLGLLKSFGHIGDDHYELGINAKASEFQAIMGLCNLQDLESIISTRREISELYDQHLPHDQIERPATPADFEYNYAYYPVLFKSEDVCLRVIKALNAENIFPRRYFYPSLNTLPYLDRTNSCPISESISSRILCLPLYVGLEADEVKQISSIIEKAVRP